MTAYVRAYGPAVDVMKHPNVVTTGYTESRTRRPIAWRLSTLPQGWRIAGPAQRGDLREEVVLARLRRRLALRSLVDPVIWRYRLMNWRDVTSLRIDRMLGRRRCGDTGGRIVMPCDLPAGHTGNHASRAFLSRRERRSSAAG